MSSKTYIISDTHFDHANIIKYCGRPFSSVKEMNKTMLNNWNNTVNDNDTVYFLGDLGRKRPEFWFKQLNGFKIWIKGNHDDLNKRMYNSLITMYNGESFMLIHTPEYLNIKWKNWIIHGHHHSNELERYPFINHLNKTINVSVELINYTPVELGSVLNQRVL
jgi:calcineurin-like phosphoesterase family protein